MICINCKSFITELKRNTFTFEDTNFNEAKVCGECYEKISSKLIAIDFSKIVIIKEKALQKYREKQLLLVA